MVKPHLLMVNAHRAQNKILFVCNCLPTHTFTPYSTFFFCFFRTFFFFFFSIFQFQSEILKLYKLTRKKNPKGSLVALGLCYGDCWFLPNANCGEKNFGSGAKREGRSGFRKQDIFFGLTNHGPFYMVYNQHTGRKLHNWSQWLW